MLEGMLKNQEIMNVMTNWQWDFELSLICNSVLLLYCFIYYCAFAICNNEFLDYISSFRVGLYYVVYYFVNLWTQNYYYSNDILKLCFFKFNIYDRIVRTK